MSSTAAYDARSVALSDWMASLPASVLSLPLHRIVLPATHDSMAWQLRSARCAICSLRSWLSQGAVRRSVSVVAAFAACDCCEPLCVFVLIIVYFAILNMSRCWILSFADAISTRLFLRTMKRPRRSGARCVARTNSAPRRGTIAPRMRCRCCRSLRRHLCARGRARRS